MIQSPLKPRYYLPTIQTRIGCLFPKSSVALLSWFLKLTPRDWPRKCGDKNVCIPLKSVQKGKIPASEAGKITWVWFDVGFSWFYFMECRKIDCSQFPVFPCSCTCTNNEKQFSLMCFWGNVNVWNFFKFLHGWPLLRSPENCFTFQYKNQLLHRLATGINNKMLHYPLLISL